MNLEVLSLLKEKWLQVSIMYGTNEKSHSEHLKKEYSKIFAQFDISIDSQIILLKKLNAEVRDFNDNNDNFYKLIRDNPDLAQIPNMLKVLGWALLGDYSTREKTITTISVVAEMMRQGKFDKLNQILRSSKQTEINTTPEAFEKNYNQTLHNRDRRNTHPGPKPKYTKQERRDAVDAMRVLVKQGSTVTDAVNAVQKQKGLWKRGCGYWRDEYYRFRQVPKKIPRT